MAITSAKVQAMLAQYLPMLGDEYKDAIFKYNHSPVTYTASDGGIAHVKGEHETKLVVLSFTMSLKQADFMEISDEPIQSKDRKGIIEVSKLPAGVPVLKDDEFEITAESITYDVIGGKLVPFQSIWLLHLRPKSE